MKRIILIIFAILVLSTAFLPPINHLIVITTEIKCLAVLLYLFRLGPPFFVKIPVGFFIRARLNMQHQVTTKLKREIPTDQSLLRIGIDLLCL